MKKAKILIIMWVFLCCLTVKTDVQAYSFHTTKTSVRAGAKKQLQVYNGTSEMRSQLFKWNSSDKKIITVSNGVIKGRQSGNAYITAKRGKQTVRCKVYVYAKVIKTGFKSYGDTVSIRVGETIKLNPKRKGTVAAYQSSSPEIVSVSKTGIVTAKKKGTAQITYHSYGKNKYTASITVQVKSSQTKYRYMGTQFIMHRGLLKEAPENTLPSFDLAGKKGAKYLECDVRRTKDGVYVVAHDSNLLRMCGVNKNIEDITYQELKKYPVTGGINAALYPENYTPTLHQYIDICNQYNATPVIELKWNCTDRQIEQLNKIFLASKQEPVVISFREPSLIKLRQINSSIGIQYIMRQGITTAALNDSKIYKFDLSVSSDYVDKSTIEKVHNQGIKIAVWNVGTEKMMKRYVNWKVDYITTEEISWIKL